MRIAIGRTRSGRLIEVPVEEDGPAAALLENYREIADRFDVFCAVSYLRTREEQGWRLTPADVGDRFETLLNALLRDPNTRTAIHEERRRGTLKTVFDDLRYGRTLVLLELRA